jgi:outer membrane protein assembly factor BamE
MRGMMIAATVATLLAGCSTYDSVTQKIAQSITPYRITVVQGNFVSQEAANQMRVGMSRDEVKQLLGTPLLTDMFHADRWDYVFYFKRGSTAVVQQRDFIVNFASDRVTSWSGGENLPSNLELLAEIDGDKGVKVAKPVAAPAGASAAVATAASGSTVTAPSASEPSTQPNAAQAFAGDANQQAAQAANRATSQVEMPTGRQRSSSFSNSPNSAGGAPGSGNSGANSQIQLQRKPQTIQIPDSSAVGPASTSPAPATVNGSQTQFTMPQQQSQ